MKIKIVEIKQDTFRMRQYGGEWWIAVVKDRKNGPNCHLVEFRSKPSPSEVVRVYWLSHFRRMD